MVQSKFQLQEKKQVTKVNYKKARFNLAFFIFSLLSVILIFILRLYFGSVKININSFFFILSHIFNKNLISSNLLNYYNIILHIRLPRFLLAFLAGGILSISGLLLQIILRNPLSGPFTLGISSSASFGAVITVYLAFFSGNYFLLKFLPIGAIIGGIISIIIIFFISLKIKQFNNVIIILIGVILNSFFSALITLFISLLSNKSYIAISWMMGYITSSPNISLKWLYLIELSIFILTFIYSRELTIFYTGEKYSLNLGIDVEKIKKIIFIFSSLMTSIIVSQTGIIGFVGIIIPHILRNITKPHYHILSIYSFIWGGIFLVASDILSQLIPAFFGFSSELPIGVITALFGAPFFLYILLKKRSVFFV